MNFEMETKREVLLSRSFHPKMYATKNGIVLSFSDGTINSQNIIPLDLQIGNRKQDFNWRPRPSLKPFDTRTLPAGKHAWETS